MTLLNEIEQIISEQQIVRAITLLESAEKLVGTLRAKLSAKPDSFKRDLNVDDTAILLTGLIVLGKNVNRQAYDDFADNSKFLKFIETVGTNSPDREYDKNRLTADAFLKEIGKGAKSSLANVKAQIEKAFMTSGPEAEELRKKFIGQLGQISTYYGSTVNKLKTQQAANKIPDAQSLKPVIA